MSQGMRAKLQKIKALRGTKLMLVIAISAIIGLWLLSSIINGIFLAPPKRPIIAPIAPKVVKPVEVPPEIKPWEKLSDPEQVMKTAIRQFRTWFRLCRRAGLSATFRVRRAV